MKAIFLIISLAVSFMPSKKNESNAIFKQGTSYYWFDTNGTYLRQNTYSAEFLLTGYDNNPAAPMTLRERGYAPANCSGTNPPVPDDPDSPDIIIYSHP